MSQTAQAAPDQAATHLLREVSVPAFMAKVAADLGYSPADDADGDRLLSLGDMISTAVEGYAAKKAAEQKGAGDGAVKAAVDSGFAAVFGRTTGREALPSADSFLTAPGVRDAAISILGQAAPAAGG